MLLASQKMDWGTMAGFGLGKLLRDGFNSWKANYDARGFINDKLLGANPEERERMLGYLKENNPDQYNLVMNRYGDRWQTPAQTATTGDNAQPDLSGINPDARAMTTARALFGNPETAFNSREVETPFGTPPKIQYDPSEFEKYKSLEEAIRRMGWQR